MDIVKILKKETIEKICENQVIRHKKTLLQLHQECRLNTVVFDDSIKLPRCGYIYEIFRNTGEIKCVFSFPVLSL